jgi:hypothetical protein
MKKQLKILAGGLAGSGIIAVSAIGAVSADSSNGNVGTSGIPRSVFKQERQEAISQVSKTGLSKQAYHAKLKSQLNSDLLAKGYSQDQVTIALQHRAIHRLRHHK